MQTNHACDGNFHDMRHIQLSDGEVREKKDTLERYSETFTGPQTHIQNISILIDIKNRMDRLLIYY